VGWGRIPALAGAGAETCAKTDEFREQEFEADGVACSKRGHGLLPGSRGQSIGAPLMVTTYRHGGQADVFAITKRRIL
jgi:hypothetical protein